MAKEHPALQELFKTRAGEPLSPLLCLVLIKDSQRFHFYMQTSSLMGCCPSCPLLPSSGPRNRKDERVQTRTDKFFNKALKTLAGVNDTELSVYLNCKATAWYRRFPPVAGIAQRTLRRPRPRLPVAMSRGRRPQRPRTTTMQRRAPWRPGLRMSPKGARSKARSAQLFLPLSEIPWYITGCYIAGLLYHTFRSRSAI